MPDDPRRPAPGTPTHLRPGRGTQPAAESLWFRKRVDTSHYASPSLFPPCTCGAKVCPDRTEENTNPQTSPAPGDMGPEHGEADEAQIERKRT